MNNEGRKTIDRIIKDVEAGEKLRAKILGLLEELSDVIAEYKSAIEDVKNEIETIRDEEQEKFDNMPEGLQQSEYGQSIEATISALEIAMESCEKLEEIEDYEFDFDSDEIITALDEAKYA